MVDRAPLLDGRAVRAGRTRRDWRGHQSERAGPLYQRSACRGAGSRAAGVRRRRRDRESQPAGWQAGGGRARRPQGSGQGSARRQPFRTTLAETWTGSYWWQGGIPVHTKEEAAVEAAAAPAMLCYVARPDAVLMEVEVEAKANGEDCLNQVRTRDQVGTRPVPIGRGASERRRVPAGRRCGSAWGECASSARSAPPTTSGRGARGPHPGAPGARWGPQRMRTASGHPAPPPPSPALSQKKAALHTCRRCVQDASCRVPAGARP